MSKHDPLTQREFSSYTFDERILDLIREYTNTNGFAESDIKVLDWGCG